MLHPFKTNTAKTFLIAAIAARALHILLEQTMRSHMQSHAGRRLSRISIKYYSSFLFTLRFKGMMISILLNESPKDSPTGGR